MSVRSNYKSNGQHWNSATFKSAELYSREDMYNIAYNITPYPLHNHIFLANDGHINIS